MFRCVENKSNSEFFPSSEFIINIDGGTAITQANIAELDLNIYTFNHDFIDKNISWDKVVKSIFLVNKAKIEECEKLEKLKKLKEKTGNPLETGLTVEAINESSIKAFNDAMTAIGVTVGKHNHKSGNFKEETDKAKKKLELHYATTEVKKFHYHDKKKDVVDRTAVNNTLMNTINNRKSEIQIREDALSNEGLEADQFNESLHKFLGRSELTLRFNPDKKGYEILRNDSDLVNGNLSEGEKTAIASVYFITKLKENDNKIEDTIVVVDDSISSFDSNHFFHAYSFMQMNCEQAMQLFLLTHNFTFFKLVCDWISRKNRRDDQNIANFYVVKANNERPRTST